MKILIAEDDIIMLETIKAQLKKDDYIIFGATDILMPYTSGLELIGILRSEQDNKLPILVLSALDEEATVMEAFSMGANDFLSKPFKPTELTIRVKRLLNNAKMGR
jgi:DNA-binding response OmpR family regulator